MLDIPPPATAASAFVALAAALILAAPVRSERFLATDHPSAVLAWANINCDPSFVLKDGAPRAHPEDLLRVSAAFDEALLFRDRAAVCAQAVAAASDVMAQDRHAAGTLLSLAR